MDREALKNKWKSTLVARSQVAQFSGGILNPKSMANLDSLGRGPARRIRIGRTVAYDVDDLITWMESRASQSWR
jgi:hypothetical protein